MGSAEVTLQVTDADPTASADRAHPPVRRALPVRVVVVSRTAMLRAGLDQLLSTDPERVAVVDLADRVGDCDSFDLAIYDLSGADEGIADDLSDLLAAGPVIALDPSHRADVVGHAIAAGVRAVVPLDITAKDLIETVQRAAAGNQDLVEELVEELHSHRRRQLAATYGLTARELSILELVATGIGNDQIAKTLWLSINTVKTYIRTTYRKIGVTSRSQAVLWTLQHELASTGNGSSDETSPPHPAARGTDSA
jgi:DNA-binding NarL/FixJ family response regulator